MGVTNCDNANVCNSRFPLGDFFLLFRGDTVSLVVAISPAGVPNGPSGSDFLIPMCIRRRGWLKARRGEKEEDLIIKETSVKCLTFFYGRSTANVGHDQYEEWESRRRDSDFLNKFKFETEDLKS